MTATLLTAILRDMPDLPEDVAEQWLAPHAARPGFGWPPPEDGRVEPWLPILAGRPLSWWRERQWYREPLPMVFEYMSHATRTHVAGLIEAADAGRDLLPDSQRRLSHLSAQIAATGTWPRAPVAYPGADGLSLSTGTIASPPSSSNGRWAGLARRTVTRYGSHCRIRTALPKRGDHLVYRTLPPR